jgi:HK97 family phage prohead protease
MIAQLGSAQRGEFSGYASLFDLEDHSRDIVRSGAFTRSLNARGVTGIRMLFQHDAGEPIGIWREISEDARGLFVRGEVLRDGPRGRAAAGLIEKGAVDGLSIGFRTVRSTPRPGGRRDLLDLDLWEVSIVTFPMLAQARLSVAYPEVKQGQHVAA